MRGGMIGLIAAVWRVLRRLTRIAVEEVDISSPNTGAQSRRGKIMEDVKARLLLSKLGKLGGDGR